jgi:TPR repeat protein
LLLALALAPTAPASARFAGFCASLGGLGVLRSDGAALQWWRVAAERGDAEACLNAGLLRQSGRAGGARSDADADAWFRVGAQRGWPAAMLALALLLLQAGGRDALDGRAASNASADVDADVAEGERWALLAAERGDSDAQFLVASRLESRAADGFTGEATTPAESVATSVSPVASLSALAWASAQSPFSAAGAAANPRGELPHSLLPDARHWFEAAALRGHAGAQFRLGLMHDQAGLAAGRAAAADVAAGTPGPPRSAGAAAHDAAAARWLALAAAQDHAWALHRLAQLASAGRLRVPDAAAATGGGRGGRYWPADGALAAGLLARAGSPTGGGHCPEAKFALGCLVADWPLGESHRLAGALPNHELGGGEVPGGGGSGGLAGAALRLWREASAGGCVDAAVLLGHMYHRGGCATGLGPAEDRNAAEAYWRSAAEAGDVGAMVLLGDLLLEDAHACAASLGTAEWAAWEDTDPRTLEAEALAWWREAQARGSTEAVDKLKERAKTHSHAR